MNDGLTTDKPLLVKYEALRASLDIRNFFLKNTVREIYENVGQALSLVRVQLAVLNLKDRKYDDGTENSPGNLVGRSIRDLRTMCNSFYPDADIVRHEGFVSGCRNISVILFPDNKGYFKEIGIKKEIEPALKLIIFKMILEILISIKETGYELVGIDIIYGIKEVIYTITCLNKESGLLSELIAVSTNGELTLEERAALIKGKIKITEAKTGITVFKLTSPFNCDL